MQFCMVGVHVDVSPFILYEHFCNSVIMVWYGMVVKEKKTFHIKVCKFVLVL